MASYECVQIHQRGQPGGCLHNKRTIMNGFFQISLEMLYHGLRDSHALPIVLFIIALCHEAVKIFQFFSS